MKKNNINLINLFLDVFCMSIVFLLYLLNNIVLKKTFQYTAVGWFFIGYFNDLICPIGFMSYLNLVCSYAKIRIEKLLAIQVCVFAAGLVWEFVAPIVKPNSVIDIWDLVCYQFGGILYYCALFFKNHCIGEGKNER